MLAESISQVPPEPFGAEASGLAVNFKYCLPEVSIKPPSPEFAPPLAVKTPPISAVSSAHKTILPPPPSCMASA